MRTLPETRARSAQEAGKRARKLSRYMRNQACTVYHRAYITGISGNGGNTHLCTWAQPLSGPTGSLTQFSHAAYIYIQTDALDRRSYPGTEAHTLRQLPRVLLSLALRNCDLRWGLSCPRLSRPRPSPRRLWLFRSFTSLTSSHLRPEAPSVYRDLFRMSHECDSRTCV